MLTLIKKERQAVIAEELHRGPHAVLRTVSRSPGLKLTISGVAYRLNYCIIIEVCTQFENVAGGHVTQPGRPWVEDPRCASSSSLLLRQLHDPPPPPLPRPAVNILVAIFLF